MPISKLVRSEIFNLLDALVNQCEKHGWWDAAVAGTNFKLALERGIRERDDMAQWFNTNKEA